MTKQLGRRQFLKAGAGGSLSLAFAPFLGESLRLTQAPPKLPERVLAAAAQSPFQALPSSLPLGSPLADISMGWDGSVLGPGSDYPVCCARGGWGIHVHGGGYNAGGDDQELEHAAGPTAAAVARAIPRTVALCALPALGASLN